MSKSPSRYLVRLREDRKSLKRKKNLHILKLYNIFQYSNVPIISRVQWLIYTIASTEPLFDVEYIYGFVMSGVCTASR